MINTNITNSVFTINGATPAIELEGCGQKTMADILSHYPLVRRGRVNIVRLDGFTINGVFSSFIPENYAKHKQDKRDYKSYQSWAPRK